MRLVGIALTALLASSCVVVVTSDCHDGFRNGSETDVDCGGDFCGPCGNGGFCSLNRDCASGFCSAGVCVPTGGGGSCGDGVRNGSETDIDCGGSCGKCAGGKACLLAADCQGNLCTGQICTPHPTGSGTNPALGDIASVQNGGGVSAPAGGYGITASGVAANVTFRVTGVAATSSDELYGTVWSSGGIISVTPGCFQNACALSSIDFVSQPYSSAGGTRIDFDLLAPQSLAGFDFDVTTNSSGNPVRFDLYVNGVQVPQQGVVFRQGTSPFSERNPATMPFALFSM